MVSKINDYVLDIGWDSKKAIDGVDRLERKIANISAKANKVDNPILGSRRATFNGEGKRIELLRNVNAQMRSLSEEGRRLPKGERFKAQRQAIAMSLVELRKYRAEMMKASMSTKQSANAMSMSLVKLTDKVQRLRNESRRLRTTLTLKDKVLRGIKGSFLSGAVATMGFYTAINLVRGAIGNAKEFQNLNIQMQAAFGNAEMGAERLEFVKGVASDLGSPIMALAKNYAQLGTAARMSGLSVKDGEDIFLAAAEAAKVFGMSQEQTDGVIRAFTQMIGKQQVMAEELKLQLGDRFPPAMGLFAKSMGISVKELTKLMEQGLVTTEHLKGFAKVLRQDVRDSGALAKAVNSLDSAMQRFGNRVKLLGAEMTGGIFESALRGTIDIFSDFIRDMTPFFAMVGDGLGVILKVTNFLLKFVLTPIQKIFKGIGESYAFIKDIALTDQSDVDRLDIISRALRFIMGMFGDIYILSLKIGNTIGKWMGTDGAEGEDRLSESRGLFAYTPQGAVIDAIQRYRAATTQGGGGSNSKTTVTNNVNIDKNTSPEMLDDIYDKMGLNQASLLPVAGT